MSTEAVKNVVKLLGGRKAVAEITKRDQSRVWRWEEDGTVPSKPMRAMLEDAAANGVYLEPNDFFDPGRLNALFESLDASAMAEAANA